MISIINEIVLRIDAKHKHSRVNPPRCSCHTIVSTRSTVYRDPKAAQGTSKTDCGGQMGGSPKAPTTASGRGNQPAGSDPESNRSCPGPMTSRGETTLSTLSLAKVQSQPRSSPDGVTVVAAPSGRKTSLASKRFCKPTGTQKFLHHSQQQERRTIDIVSPGHTGKIANLQSL